MLEVDFGELVGKTIIGISTSPDVTDGFIEFTCHNFGKYAIIGKDDDFQHTFLMNIYGKKDWLIGERVISVNVWEDTSRPPLYDWHNSNYGWSYYEIATEKGSVCLEFYACSNDNNPVGVIFVK